MVKSLLDGTIDYITLKNITDDDKNYVATLYEIPLFGETFTIALGKPKTEYIDKNVIYYPVYNIKNDIVDSKIGVYEILSSKQIDIYDDDDDVDLSKLGEILLYPHVSLSFLTKSRNELEEMDESSQEQHNKKEILLEQNAEQAMLEKSAYKKTGGEFWVQTFMHNNNYSVVENEGGSDCLFASIRDGLMKNGTTKTVIDLREILADNATEEIFDNFFKMYKNVQESIESIGIEIASYKQKLSEIKLIAKKTSNDRDKLLSFISTSESLNNSISGAELRRTSSKQMLIDCKFMKGVKSFEHFKDKLITVEFWGGKWAISVLEKVLNIKVILFNRESYKAKDLENVMLCGGLNNSLFKEGDVFSPSQYIFLEYTGNHYRLATYKDRGTLSFIEIPYDIKLLVIDKCMEGMSGPFSIIPDFNSFMSKLRSNPSKDINKLFEQETTSLYNNNNVFQFYKQSANGPAPGKGVGEKIQGNNELKFNELSIIPDWRRKLSNFWIEPFDLDGHTWSSIEHFYQASKFKQNNPHFYLSFTLDKNPKGMLAKNAIMANDAGSKSGKHKGKLVRPIDVMIDETFFGRRDKESISRALVAKFKQKEFKHLLLSTKDAKLQMFVRSALPVPYIALMELRKEFEK